MTTTELPLPQHFSGTAKDGWQEVMEAFRYQFLYPAPVTNINIVHSDEKRSGQALAVYYKGQLVVDAWGGYMDIEKQRKWESNTVACGFSTTKAVSALVVAMLVDRGLLSYDDKVVKFWPEFGQNGKENITVKILLSHQGGLPAVEEPITFETMKDWQALGKILAAQKPFWEPGTAYGYHALTFGLYVDQLVRRVDTKGRSISQFIKEEVTTSNEIDWRIGLPSTEWHRMAQGIEQENNAISAIVASTPVPFVPLAFKNPPFVASNPEFYSVDNPSVNGVGTARGLAKLFSLFAEGKLVKHELIEQLSQPLNGLDDKKDLVTGLSFTCGWGFFHKKPPGCDYYVLNHVGYGGQMVKFDAKKQLAFAYFRNHYTGLIETTASDAIEATVYKNLG